MIRVRDWASSTHTACRPGCRTAAGGRRVWRRRYTHDHATLGVWCRVQGKTDASRACCSTTGGRLTLAGMGRHAGRRWSSCGMRILKCPLYTVRFDPAAILPVLYRLCAPARAAGPGFCPRADHTHLSRSPRCLRGNVVRGYFHSRASPALLQLCRLCQYRSGACARGSF